MYNDVQDCARLYSNAHARARVPIWCNVVHYVGIFSELMPSAERFIVSSTSV